MERFKYIKSLDGLRGLSIIQVILFHLSIYHGGTFLIQGFMVQSGYLITVILLKNKEKELSTRLYFKSFHYNRFLRIMPLYFMYIFLCCSVYIALGRFDGLSEKLLHLSIFNFNNSRLLDSWSHDPTFTHLWTLSLDMQFYLLWPFAVRYLGKKPLIVLILVFVLLGPLLRYETGLVLSSLGKSSFYVGNSVYVFSLSHFDAFMIGSLVPLIDWDRFVKTHFIPVFVGVMLVAVGGFTNYILSKGQFGVGYWKNLGYPFSSTKNLMHVWNYTFSNIMFFSLLIVLTSSLSSRTKKVVSKVLEFRVFTFLGKYTFGIYVFHGVIITMVQQTGLFDNKWLSVTIVFGCAILLAMLSFHFYEKQFLKRKIRV